MWLFWSYTYIHMYIIRIFFYEVKIDGFVSCISRICIIVSLNRVDRTRNCYLKRAIYYGSIYYVIYHFSLSTLKSKSFTLILWIVTLRCIWQYSFIFPSSYILFSLPNLFSAIRIVSLNILSLYLTIFYISN